jgi:hypothetical protein
VGGGASAGFGDARMNLFPLTRDIQAFMLRMTASLERIDNVAAEAQILIRNANDAITEIRQITRRFGPGVTIQPKE